MTGLRLRAVKGSLMLLSSTLLTWHAWCTVQVLELPASDIAARMLALKEVLPGCDAPYLLEKHPQ